MIPSRAIIGGFTLTLMAGLAVNGFSLSSNAVAPNGAAAPSVGANGYSDGPRCPDNGHSPDHFAAWSNGNAGCATGRTACNDTERSSRTRLPGGESVTEGARFESSPRLLDALRSAESLGSDVSKPNCKGALGPYQFLRRTWDDHARGVPWSEAVDEPTARVVADRYLTWLDRTITDWSGQPATLDQVLAAWNGGIGTLRSVGFDPSRMTTEEAREFPGRVRSAMEAKR